MAFYPYPPPGTRPIPEDAVEVPVQPVVGVPYVGWRYWRVIRTHSGLRLTGMWYRYQWPPDKPLTAQCKHSPIAEAYSIALGRESGHQSPAPLYRMSDGTLFTPCTSQPSACGIYALRKQYMLRDRDHYTMLFSLRDDGLGGCSGRVELWGRVIPYERGYRAEYARPLGPLTFHPSERVTNVEEMIDELSAIYGVEVTDERERELGCVTWVDVKEEQT